MGKLVTAPKVDAEWRVEADLACLQEAEKIERDPKRMKAVRALAKKRLAELEMIANEGNEDKEKKQ